MRQVSKLPWRRTSGVCVHRGGEGASSGDDAHSRARHVAQWVLCMAGATAVRPHAGRSRAQYPDSRDSRAESYDIWHAAHPCRVTGGWHPLCAQTGCPPAPRCRTRRLPSRQRNDHDTPGGGGRPRARPGATGLHRHGTESALGRGHHRHSDVDGLPLSGRRPRCLLSARCRLGDGGSSAGRTGCGWVSGITGTENRSKPRPWPPLRLSLDRGAANSRAWSRWPRAAPATGRQRPGATWRDASSTVRPGRGTCGGCSRQGVVARTTMLRSRSSPPVSLSVRSSPHDPVIRSGFDAFGVRWKPIISSVARRALLIRGIIRSDAGPPPSRSVVAPVFRSGNTDDPTFALGPRRSVPYDRVRRSTTACIPVVIDTSSNDLRHKCESFRLCRLCRSTEL